jgi:hypothetical protein
LIPGQLPTAAYGARTLEVTVNGFRQALGTYVDDRTEVFVAFLDVDGFETSQVGLHVAALADPPFVAVHVFEVNDDVDHSPAELAELGAQLVANILRDVRGEWHVW